MRLGRIKFNGPGYYHIICKIVDGAFKFDEKEQREFLILLVKVMKFSGVRIIDFVIMSNHIHLIVFVSGLCLACEEVLLERYRALYKPEEYKKKKELWERLRKTGQEKRLEEERNKLRRRMENISEFMKTLNQRFSMGYNHRHHREGTMWTGRFKSLLADPRSLPILSAYIDLNPVRVGKVSDPKDYRYSGYGQAIRGKKWAQKGLQEAYQFFGETVEWEEIAKRHRMIIYGYGGKNGIHPAVFNRAQVEKVLREGGVLTLFELLRCRIRYFTNGFAIGTLEFVERCFREHPRSFGSKRKTGARRFRGYGGELGELFVARDLRKDVIIPMKV